MIELVQRLAAWLMNRVRVNQVQETLQDGLPVIVKRRRAGAPLVTWVANQFLALAESGICMCVRAGEWADWEIHCSHLLYPERPGIRDNSIPAVIFPKVSGISLRELLHRDVAEVRKAFIFAARELRRVHQLPCSHYKAPWSHGDLHLDNILFNRNTSQAVLIDFDTRHEFRIGPTQRHSDDLKTVLMEIIGMADEKWTELAAAFVGEYGEPSVLHEMNRQLFIPTGFARVLWFARTNYAPIQRTEARLKILREIIRQALHAG